MKKLIIPIAITTVLFACNKPATEEANKTSLTLAENAYTILPMETEASWDCSKLLNIDAKFDREKLVNTFKNAVLSGKLKAYRNYPEGELTVKEVEGILVKWDSTHTVDDINNPGTMVIAPIKLEINADNSPELIFNETTMLDTLTYTISKKVSYVTLTTYKKIETGEAIGVLKLFDIKLN